MKSTLLVVTDLACLKAYRVENGQPHRAPHLELVEEFNNPGAHGRLVDKVTDLAGRFPRAAGAMVGMSDGERHNIERESRKRLVRQLAQRLNVLARDPKVEQCLLAASREINHQLLAELEPQVRAKIQKNLPADLTKVEAAELLRHFDASPAAAARAA
jgi:Protein required for attachment to host cells